MHHINSCENGHQLVMVVHDLDIIYVFIQSLFGWQDVSLVQQKEAC